MTDLSSPDFRPQMPAPASAPGLIGAIRRLAAEAQDAQAAIDRLEEAAAAGEIEAEGEAERLAYLRLCSAQDDLVATIAEAERAGLMAFLARLMTLAQPVAGRAS
jgi:hypothetical protein